MKTQIIESFNFPNTNASIYLNWMGEEGYHPFVGGGGISKAVPTIQEARKIIFNFLKSEINLDINQFNAEIIKLNSLNKELGNDEFNLGKFLVKTEE